jgi:hypothetical protein
VSEATNLQESIEQLVGAVENRLAFLQSNCSSRIDAANISKAAKLPFKATWFFEALSWRMAELCRAGLESLQTMKLASGILLVRGAVETSAAIWYLRRKLSAAVESGALENVDESVMKMLMGSKIDPNLPQALNVMTFVRDVEKEINGFENQYGALSEIAHPNWAGTAFLYSNPDHNSQHVDFGAHLRGRATLIVTGLTNLDTALLIFNHSRLLLAELVPPFALLCESKLALTPRRRLN